MVTLAALRHRPLDDAAAKAVVAPLDGLDTAKKWGELVVSLNLGTPVITRCSHLFLPERDKQEGLAALGGGFQPVFE